MYVEVQHIERPLCIGDILCVFQSCTKDPTGELQFETRICHSLIQHCVRILQACIYIAFWYATTPDNKTHLHMYLMTAYMYYTPNDGFTDNDHNDASFYKNEVGQLHDTL